MSVTCLGRTPLPASAGYCTCKLFLTLFTPPTPRVTRSAGTVMGRPGGIDKLAGVLQAKRPTHRERGPRSGPAAATLSLPRPNRPAVPAAWNALTPPGPSPGLYSASPDTGCTASPPRSAPAPAVPPRPASIRKLPASDCTMVFRVSGSLHRSASRGTPRQQQGGDPDQPATSRWRAGESPEKVRRRRSHVRSRPQELGVPAAASGSTRGGTCASAVCTSDIARAT